MAHRPGGAQHLFVGRYGDGATGRLTEEEVFASQFLTAAAAAWLAALWLAWAGLLFGGFVFGRPSADCTRRMPAWTRLGSSLALVAAGWSWLALGGGRAAPLPLLIATGMSLGFVGDLCMAGLLPWRERVLPGMSAFGLGHVAYIAGILAYGDRYGLAAAGPRLGAWLAWLAVGLAGWYVVVWRPAGRRGTLQRAALPYALLLSSTAGCATGLALQDAAFWPMAAGAALFLLSDLILAARLFNGAYFSLIDDVVWLTYGPGQMLIVYAVAGALARLPGLA